jgi:ParB family chromosome partitioning protein
MSDAQTSKPQKEKKGLGRGLGSLLGNSGEGAFSKSTPAQDNLVEKLSAELPSQQIPAIKEGFAEKTEALKTEAAAPAPVVPQVPAHMRIWNIAIEKLFPNPNQPRQVFDKEPLEELALSIMEKGIIQPLLVRKGEDDTFEIIAGERRWRAAQIAGLKEVPALLKNSEDQEVLELALIENIQRENLNPIEESEAYDFLMKKYNLTQEKLATKVGKDRATVANMLRLLNLQPGVRQMVSRKELSMGQAKVLLGLTDPKLQEKMAEKAKNLNLSVRALEKMVAAAKNPQSEKEMPEDLPSKMAKALGEELQKLIGSKVQLDYEKGKGKITINFYSDQELNQIADTLRDSWRH